MSCDPEKSTGDLPPCAYEHLFGARFDTSTPEHAYPGVVGDYQILGVIGTGGNGVVFEGRHQRTGRGVAVKIVRPDRCTPDGLARFEVEWRTLAELEHHNIATILDCGWYESTAGRAPFYVMELIQGRQGRRPSDICEYASRANLTLEHRMAALVAICAAVQHAHDKGVIHRDLKPGNIPVDESGEGETGEHPVGTPKVVDFGLSHVLGAAIVRPSAATGPREIAGTLRYMSPEQVRGDVEHIGTWTDVHALGLIGHELAIGQLPYDLCGLSEEQALNHIQTAPRCPADQMSRAVDKRLSEILAATVIADPRKRTPTARQLGNALQAWISARRRAARVAQVRLGIVLTGCVVLAAALAMSGGWPPTWIDLEQPWEQWAVTHPPALADAPLQSVRVVTVDETVNDQRVLDAISHAHETGPMSATEVGGLRPLYGLVARTIIERGHATAVALDISFARQTKFDDSFVQSVGPINEEARGRAVPAIVVGMPRTAFDSAGAPKEMAPALLRVSPFLGNLYGVFESDRMWKIELLGQFDQKAPIASLAAMLFAKSYPGAGTPMFTLGTNGEPSHAVLGPVVGVETGADLLLPSAPIGTIPPDPEDSGPGDAINFDVAEFRILLPEPRTLNAATVRLMDVLDAAAMGDEGTARLRAWFERKAVLIGDARKARRDGLNTDLQPAPDGTSLPGVYAHAVATQWLMDGRSIRLPGKTAQWAMTVVMCLAGVATAWIALARGRASGRVSVGSALAAGGLLLVALVWTSACVGAFWLGMWLVFPWTGLLGLAIAFVLGAITVTFLSPAASHAGRKV